MKRKALFAGTSYPSGKNELNDLIKKFEQDNIKYFSRAVIVPHAGYKYSGKLTSSGIQHLKKDLTGYIIRIVTGENKGGAIKHLLQFQL